MKKTLIMVELNTDAFMDLKKLVRKYNIKHDEVLQRLITQDAQRIRAKGEKEKV